MGANTAFVRNGATIAIPAVSTPSSNPVQCVSNGIGSTQYRVVNSGTVTAFLGFGSTSAEASSNTAVVTSSGNSIPLLAGAVEIITLPPNAYFFAITATGGGTIYITPGDGV